MTNSATAKFMSATLSFALCCFAVSCEAQAWQPAASPLVTRWSRDVSPEKAWPDYPRPQMVRPDWTNLNGLWDYSIRPKADEVPQQWDGKILVPFAVESALSGVKQAVTPEQRLWYRRAFSKPKLAENGRLLLHFGAVDWQTTVWINGSQVGQHSGGYDPFMFDITDALRDGENELVVAVWDPTDTGSQPRGKQVLKPESIWYTAVTGIWQTVWLEPTPADHIDSLKIVPDVDRKVASVSVAATGGDRIRVTATSQGQRVATAEGQVGSALVLKIDHANLWSPDSPNLYDLKVELLNGSAVADSVASYFGMRKIEVRKDANGINRIMLNNEPLFELGPLDQGWWPDGLYTAPTDEALRYDIVQTKSLGMNMARKHVKCECDRWYYWCDKLGLLVWQDMPSGNCDRDDSAKANYLRELQAVIDALRNHPSIVMWVPFNEGWGQHDTAEIVNWIKSYDPSRLVDEASGWHDQHAGDVSDMHSYPGPGMRPLEKDRALVLGEFCGLGMPVAGHTWQDKKNWGYVSYQSPDELTAAYVALLVKLEPLIAQGLCAAVYTQTSDVEIEVNGLMTYDRAQLKMDANRIATAARRLYDAPSTKAASSPAPGQP
jgi:hypothetical protein